MTRPFFMCNPENAVSVQTPPQVCLEERSGHRHTRAAVGLNVIGSLGRAAPLAPDVDLSGHVVFLNLHDLALETIVAKGGPAEGPCRTLLTAASANLSPKTCDLRLKERSGSGWWRCRQGAASHGNLGQLHRVTRANHNNGSGGHWPRITQKRIGRKQLRYTDAAFGGDAAQRIARFNRIIEPAGRSGWYRKRG